MYYEALFTEHGYHVLWCSPTLLWQSEPFLEREYIKLADLNDTPAAGPFVFWVLLAKPLGRPAGRWTEPSSSARRHSPMRAEGLSSQERDLLANLEGVTAYSLPYRYPVLLAHNLSDGCVLVDRGRVVMSRNGTVKQTFYPGDLVGELESGGDMFASRFLYSLHAADKDGVSLLFFPSRLLKTLLDCDETIAGRLFRVLRDRVAMHSWIYHKSAGRARKGQKGSLESRFSTSLLEHCARALLFCATAEARAGGPSNGLTVVVTPEELFRLMRDVYTAEAPQFKDELLYLTALGIVDTIADGARHFQEQFRDSWYRILSLATRRLLRRTEVERPWEGEAVVFAAAGQLLAFPGEGQLCRIGGPEPGTLRLTDKWLPNVNDLRQQCRQLLKGDYSAERFAQWLGNLGWLRQMVFRTSGTTTVFVQINDMHFLRRIACSSDQWESDFRRRVERSPLFNRGRPVPYVQQFEDRTRLGAYLARMEDFVAQHWYRQRNLGLSTDQQAGRTRAIDDFALFYSRAWVHE